MIGIFDSGIGGVNVLKEIIKLNPNYKYIYYSDSKNNPYGDKSKDEIYEMSLDATNYLLEKGCQIIVIACNTASAVCSKKLREKYPNIPFIAIEPAYKMVHDNNPSGKTLVMATRGTIESEKFQKLYHKYDNNNTVLYPCSGLAELIEEGNKTKIKTYLEEHLSDFKGTNNVVLGCTHYPLIKNEIRNVLGEVKFFDGSYGVSKELKKQIENKNIKSYQETSITFIDSSNSLQKEKRFFDILNSKIV